MNKVLYKVCINGREVARGMDLNTAVIVIKAIFLEYFDDHEMQVCLMEQEELA